MSRYLPTIELKTVFEDDEVTVTLNQLSRAAFIKIVSAAAQIRSESDDEATQRARMVDVAAEVLEDHLTKIEGLKDAHGNATPKEDVLSSVYFSALLLECFDFLISKGKLGKASSSASEEKSQENSVVETPTTS